MVKWEGKRQETQEEGGKKEYKNGGGDGGRLFGLGKGKKKKMKCAGSTLAYLSVNQAEKELQETNAKLKLLTASQTDGITIRTIFPWFYFYVFFFFLFMKLTCTFF